MVEPLVVGAVATGIIALLAKGKPAVVTASDVQAAPALKEQAKAEAVQQAAPVKVGECVKVEYKGFKEFYKEPLLFKEFRLKLDALSEQYKGVTPYTDTVRFQEFTAKVGALQQEYAGAMKENNEATRLAWVASGDEMNKRLEDYKAKGWTIRTVDTKGCPPGYRCPPSRRIVYACPPGKEPPK